MPTSPTAHPKFLQIALTIRDWLGPFYTLGGVVAFLILLLSLLDPTGSLLRTVNAVLLTLASVSVLAYFFGRARLGAAGERFFAAHGHWILCLIAAFFACGMLLSHRIQSAPRSTPTAQQPAFVAPAPVAPEAPPIAAATPVVAPPASAPRSPVAPKPTPAVVTHAAAPVAAVATSTVRSATPKAGATPASNPRCTHLVQRLGLGETLAGDDLDFLRKSCGS